LNSLKYLVEARTLEGKGSYAEASKKYGQVVRMDPNNSDARTQMTEMQARVQSNVRQLMNTGDSLMDKKNFERAQRLYEQALESDPESELLILRLQDVAVLLKQTTQSSLARAKSLLDRSQLDEAQREYERILSSDARNAAARTGLETIKTRRVADQVEQGKTAFNEAKYFEALSIFSEILQRDDKNREAKTMFDKTREALLPEVDKFFKAGLQFYVKENYKSAIESWDKALLIQPQHQATLEYYKRAQEKLKAIEKLEKEN
ncbi:MAG: tetratricopeptide repeat protein, partial [Bacteroidota bacterium]